MKRPGRFCGSWGMSNGRGFGWHHSNETKKKLSLSNAKPRKHLRRPVIERLFEKLKYTSNGCWEFTGKLSHYGYSQISVPTERPGKARSLAGKGHRIMYEYIFEESPGDTTDHECRNRACCNPFHLTPTTRGKNVLSGNGISAKYARRTHCKHGHELTEQNVYRWSGNPNARMCRKCHAERERLRVAK